MFLHGYDDNTLELCFGKQNKNKELVNKLVNNPRITLDNGIEGLSRVVNSGKISPEIVKDYTHIVYKNRLEILYGYKYHKDRQSEEEYQKIKETYKDIIQNANKYYDIVLVDLDNYPKDEMVNQILKISDVIVFNIEQKLNMINEFANIKNEMNDKKNIMLNIGRFDDYSKYTIKNISRYLGIKRDITVIPYNTLYFEAASEENVADFFLKIRKISDTDRNSMFMKQVKEAVEKIIYKLQEVQMRG